MEIDSCHDLSGDTQDDSTKRYIDTENSSKFELDILTVGINIYWVTV